MSDSIERLLVRVEANAEHFERQMKRVNRALYGSQTQTRRTMAAMQRDTERAASRMFKPIGENFRREVAGLTGVLAGLFTAQQIGRMADSWTDLSSRVRLAIDDGEDVAAVMDRIATMARRTYSSLEQTAEGYLLNATALRELGYSTQQSLNFVESLNNALVVSGAKGQRAESVMTALSKAMALGTLQGDNLNTVMASGGRVAEVLAAHLGVARNDLYRLGKEGAITTAAMIGALTGSMMKLRAEAESMPATLSDAVQVLNNELGRLIGQQDQSLSATQRLAKAIELLADNLDVVAVAGGVAITIVGTRLVVAQGAAAVSALAHAHAQITLLAALAGTTRGALAASVAMHGLGRSALFFVAHPIGIALLAVAAAMALVAANAEKATPATRTLGTATDDLTQATQAYEMATLAAATASGEGKKAALEEARALRVAQVEKRRAAEDSLKLARALLAQAQAQLTANTAALNAPENQDARTRGGLSQVQSGLRNRVDPLVAAIAATEKAITDADAAIARIDRGLAAGGGAGGVGGDGEAPRAAADRQTDLRAELELEEALAAARATGNDATIRAEEERQRLIQLTQRYQAAGYTDAAQRALALLALENQAVQLTEDRERIEEEIDLILEGRRRQMEREDRLLQLQNDQLLDRLGVEGEIARLTGDPRRIARAERELWIEERINELRRLRPGLSRDEARNVASTEADTFDAAAFEGSARDVFRRAVRDGVRGALEGDLSGAASAFAGQLADRAIDQISELAFDALFGGVDAVAEGAAQGSAMAATAGPAIAAAGVTAGASMAAAITTAGAAAGAAMAAAITAANATSMFRIPGFDAGGYTGPGGVKQPAGVVHKGEVVWSQADVRRVGGPAAAEAIRRGGLPGYDRGGYVSVIPALNRAVASVGRVQGGGGATGSPIVFDLRHAVMTEDLLAQMNALAAQAQAGAVGRVAAASAQRQRRAQFQTRR
ncbi:tape measure protein, partial [uncultured Brevundimonas sp.]|uniref:tape measure protein n=1 Tax=uncultured Brevundimonas sp. TaxID=213418 RepID=UPI002616C7C3